MPKSKTKYCPANKTLTERDSVIDRSGHSQKMVIAKRMVQAPKIAPPSVQKEI